jgi:hypothetical protein
MEVVIFNIGFSNTSVVFIRVNHPQYFVLADWFYTESRTISLTPTCNTLLFGDAGGANGNSSLRLTLISVIL